MTSITVDGVTYNDDAYDAVTNPYGFGNGGHLKRADDPDAGWIAALLHLMADATRAVRATSATSLAIGLGSKQFTLASEVTFAIGAWVVATATADVDNWMIGQVTAQAGTLLTVDVRERDGTGTFTAWDIQITGRQGPAGADGSDGADGNGFFGGIAGGTADALTTTASPTMASYDEGNVLFLEALHANATTAATLNASGHGAKTIRRLGGLALRVGDIAGVGHVLILRDGGGTQPWELLNPSDVNAPEMIAGRIAALSMFR